jgi:hypothetical protein
MENQDRKMGDIKGERGEIKKKATKGNERLTIMIFKKVGKVRAFKVSPRFLLWALLFFLFYIVGTILMTNAYFDAYRTNRVQSKTITTLTSELAKTKKDLERSKQHIALLDEYIGEDKELTPEPMSGVDYTESSFPKSVDIDDLKAARDGSTLHVSFKIFNKQTNEGPIGGYIFVLASVKDSEKSEVWIYPSTLIKDGVPVDYRKGTRFFIQRFRTVTGTYTLNKVIDGPLMLQILVFDRNGRLTLRKVIEV